MKMNRLCVLLATIALALPTWSFAGGVDCAHATALVPDGRLLDFDNIQPGSTNWYQFTAVAGRSYSIEVRDDINSDPGTQELQVAYYGPNSTCANLQAIPATMASVTDTHATEPVLPTSASRSSVVTCPAANFTGSCTGSGAGTYLIKVVNGNTTTSHYVSIGVTETTIYSEFWQMNSTLITQWIFQNTTSQTISYTMTAVASNSGSGTYVCFGTVAAVSTSGSNLVISPNTFTVPGAIPTNPSASGGAIFTHNGPPGAIQPFGFWINYNTTPWAMIPIPVGPMRGK